MYQTAASECIQTLVEQCLGVPLLVRACAGSSRDTSLVYDDADYTVEEGEGEGGENDVKD